MLEIKNLTKKYGKKEALVNANIIFNKGIYGLLGPNGAGKSTMMNIIADILKPTSGEVLYDGQNIKQLKSRYRLKIGYLPQKVGYYGDFTAKQTLEYFAVLRGVEKNQMKERIDRMLAMVNLSENVNDKVMTFSGGMKQRLGIAVTMISEPEILIFDEPTVGLDPKERLNFRKLLKQISKERTVILSTHIVSDLNDIADYVLILKEGCVVENKKMDSESLEKLYLQYFGNDTEDICSE